VFQARLLVARGAGPAGWQDPDPRGVRGGRRLPRCARALPRRAHLAARRPRGRRPRRGGRREYSSSSRDREAPTLGAPGSRSRGKSPRRSGAARLAAVVWLVSVSGAAGGAAPGGGGGGGGGGALRLGAAGPWPAFTLRLAKPCAPGARRQTVAVPQWAWWGRCGRGRSYRCERERRQGSRPEPCSSTRSVRM
jgi:hypothetical protein